jgi:hypothetical protein
MSKLKLAAYTIATPIALFGAPASGCEQVCYQGLPCQATEIMGDFVVDTDLCAGDLILHDHARLIVPGGAARLISVERKLKINGQAEIVTRSALTVFAKMLKARSGPSGASYARGPETNGPGDANAGKHGGNGEAGAHGADGQDGARPPDVTLHLAEFEGGILKITAKGGPGQDGQDGGDGGRGGDGEQGGRSIPAQPFGCRSGPGQGGNAGRGGDAGRGGAGGDGANGGNIAIEVPNGQRAQIQGLIAKQIPVDLSGGRAGMGGSPGTPGTAGLFGYGGRGSTGCEGRVEERKGSSGSNGNPASAGRNGVDGQQGKLTLSGVN